jgi:quercetin dioxygenase-like cupin family protein
MDRRAMFESIMSAREPRDERIPMLTRRDFTMIAAGIALTLVGMTAAEAQPKVLESQTFDWASFTPRDTKVGKRRDVLRSPTATLDELEIHVTTLNPGETPHPPHQHPAEELFVIKEGTVEALVNGQLRRVGPGSVIFQASNVPHGIKNVGDSPATYHVIQWQSPGMLKQ